MKPREALITALNFVVKGIDTIAPGKREFASMKDGVASTVIGDS